MPNVRDWPTGPAWKVAGVQWGVSVPRSRFVSPDTGQAMSWSRLGQRISCVITLPACVAPAEIAERAAWLDSLASSGDWVRLAPKQSARLGTAAGAAAAAQAAAAGATGVQVGGLTAGATFAPGDFFGIGGQLLQASYATYTANGLGVAQVGLVLPLRKPVSAAQPVVLDGATGVFQLTDDRPMFSYAAGRVQSPIDLTFTEVI